MELADWLDWNTLMQHPIEICLTFSEWVEDRRGKAAARRARREPETKTIWTFLSQGAVGGAIGYLALVAGMVIVYPAEWNIFYFYELPLLLAVGAVLGSVVAIFVWLPGVLFKERFKFVVRAVLVTGMMALTVALSDVIQRSNHEHWSLAGIVGFVCIFYGPIVLMTGSSIRPCRVLLLGAGPRSSRYNLGSWLSIPAGFLLRTASVFGLLEALMVLSLWISSGRAGWGWSPERRHLPAIILAILYFATSSSLSIKTPRKFLLLPTIILLNVPLAGLIVHLKMHFATPEFENLSSALLAIIWLWLIYTLGRLVAPEPAGRLVAPESARRVAGSWAEEAAILKLSPRQVCQGQV